MRRKRFLRNAALVLVAAGVACDAGADGDNPEADAAAGGPMRPAPAQVAPIDHSGVTGTVVSDQVDGELTVTLALEGLEVGEIYSAYLHEGRCADSGALRTPLGAVRPTAEGTATVRFRAGVDELPSGTTASIQIRGERGVGARACANLLPAN